METLEKMIAEAKAAKEKGEANFALSTDQALALLLSARSSLEGLRDYAEWGKQTDQLLGHMRTHFLKTKKLLTENKVNSEHTNALLDALDSVQRSELRLNAMKIRIMVLMELDAL